MKVAFDSNIFIFSLDRKSPRRQIAQKLLLEASTGQHELVLTHQNLTETYRVITSPNMEHPFAPAEAVKELRKWITHFELIAPNQETNFLFLKWVGDLKIIGYRTFDIFLAATLVSHGISLLYSANAGDFKNLSQELSVLDPFQGD